MQVLNDKRIGILYENTRPWFHLGNESTIRGDGHEEWANRIP